MKKLFSIVLLTVLCITANAQGTWTTVKVAADELKGVKGGVSYLFSVDSIGSIKIKDWKKDDITITTNNGIFEYSKHEYENPLTNVSKVVHVSQILIGLYNNEGVLLEKVDGESYFDEDSPKSLHVVGRTFTQQHKIKRMLKAVQSGEGYLRIIVKRKDLADFDLKTTPYQNAH